MNNCDLMDQLFKSIADEANAGPMSPENVKENMDNIKAIFDQWGVHHKRLIGYCNDLLQLNIAASRVVAKPKKTAITVERDITEQLMEARIHHKQRLADGWVVTAEYCLDLAKARYHEGKDTVYSDAACSEVQLTLFEQNILAKAQSSMPPPGKAKRS